MNKSQLAKKIQKQLVQKDFPADVTKLEVVKTLTELFFQHIKNSLNAGENVQLRGVGFFSKKLYSNFIARNPATGEKVKVPARFSAIYHASPKFLAFLNDTALSDKGSGEA